MEEKTDYDLVEESDGIEQGHAKTPMGWKLYVGATVVWMIYYIYAYTPVFTGWTQSQAFDALAK